VQAVDVRRAAEDRPDLGLRVELLPLGASADDVGDLAVGHPPPAVEEVEIVLTHGGDAKTASLTANVSDRVLT
jgi:hypothetical protein